MNPKINEKSTISELQNQINEIYTRVFSRTPLQQRLNDISKEAIELIRYTDLKSLKEESGDLLTSLIQLFNECEWSMSELATNNLEKILRRKNQYKAFGRKTQVALLGGAFNPVSVGHIQVAQLVLNSSAVFDEVWLLPCYNHMYNKNMVSAKHRLNMCAIASEKDARIKVCNYEIRNKFRGETYNLTKRLLDDDHFNSKFSFSFIIGLDNANTFDKWVNYDELERLIRFVVVPRTGETKKKGVNWYLKPPHIFLEPDKPLMKISSTDIRKMMMQYYQDHITPTKLIKGFKGLNPKVFEYILDNKLYSNLK